MLTKLAANGHSASAIAAMLNRAFGTAFDGAAIRHKAAARGIALRRAKDAAAVVQVSLSRETERALRSAARERGQRLESLVQDIVAVVAGDHLVAAVLDIPVPAPRRRPNGAAANAAAPRS